MRDKLICTAHSCESRADLRPTGWHGPIHPEFRCPVCKQLYWIERHAYVFDSTGKTIIGTEDKLNPYPKNGTVAEYLNKFGQYWR
jgi:hypothetical protein